MLTRRDLLRAALLGSAALTALPARAQQPPSGTLPPPPGAVVPPGAAAATGPFFLPPLPYDYNALEPHIDALTMQIHHDKHHAAYVANLNKAIASRPDLANKSLDDLLRGLLTDAKRDQTDPTFKAIRNNGGGHYNHSLFWLLMKKDGGGAPTGEFAAALDKQFGTFAAFQTQFTDAAAKVFGSGWAWLSASPDGTLKLETTPNQDSPLMYGRAPLLGLDIWEHAYYLKHQNRRPEYIAAWWNVVNWDFVSERYAKSRTA